MFNMKGNALDVLAAVAGRGKQIFEDHIAATEKKRETRIYCHDDGEASTSTAPNKTKLNINFPQIQAVANGQHSPLPEEFGKFIEEMGNGKTLTPATLVIQKCLFYTDVNPSHNRLSIRMSQIMRDDFLTDDEKRRLNEDKERKKFNDYEDKERKKKNFMVVKIIEPSLKLETVKFCRWDMPKKGNCGRTSSSYVINGNWSAIMMRNGLRKEMGVQLWCFRIDQKLCFALVRLPRNSIMMV
ncbi:hypothetical protein C2S52_012126 [Perilla frutescens var. hirtella]|nr:hypothetical protein C2S52_012126 [Perilla frutescens var. hirtella]